MAAFVVGGVWWQLSDLKTDFDHFQDDMEILKIDQAKDNDFRASGEQFFQRDGTQLELRTRDYTDQQIRDSLVSIGSTLTKLESAIVRVNDKIDELAMRP